MRFFLQPLSLYNIIIACLKKDSRAPEEDLLSSLTPDDWEPLLELADMQRITPLLWHRLKHHNQTALLPETIAQRMQAAYRQNTLRNLSYHRDLARLLALLREEKIPILLLKGIVLCNTVYESIGLREMNDIDALVHPGDLQRTTDILLKLGYKPAKAFSMDTIAQTGHHLPRFMKKGSVSFEIHWNLTNDHLSYSTNPEDLWQRAAELQIAGFSALSLSPEDLLLHICLHASYMHAFTFGLRPFCDITEIIDHFKDTFNWQIFSAQTAALNSQHGVYLALRLAVDLTGARVPDEVLAELQPEANLDQILQTVQAQLFTDKYIATSIPAPFAHLLESRSLIDKIRIFLSRLFLPRNILSVNYGVPTHSPKIYFCYLLRLRDVLRRHASTLTKYQASHDAVKSLAARTKEIDQWLK